MSEDLHSNVYSKPVLEFITIVGEYCAFVEQAAQQPPELFLDKVSKLLPLIYLKSSLLEKPEEVFSDEVERFVSEEQYYHVLNGVASVTGAEDDYLEVFHPDIQYSDGPVRASISENLADIYQHLKDFFTLYQLGSEEIMNDGLAALLIDFEEVWGQKLTNVLRAVHSVKFNANFEEDASNEGGRTRDDFYTRLQKDWGDDNE